MVEAGKKSIVKSKDWSETLTLAASLGHCEMVRYLYTKTDVLDWTQGEQADLFTTCIHIGLTVKVHPMKLQDDVKFLEPIEYEMSPRPISSLSLSLSLCFLFFFFIFLGEDSSDGRFRVRYEFTDVHITLPTQKPPADKPNPKTRNCKTLWLKLSEQGETILHVAALARQEKFAKNLVTNLNREDMEITNNDSNNAFCLAAISGDVKIAKLIVEAGNKELLISKPDESLHCVSFF
ncbi:hypothetical protein FEM48_Zijuj03G0131700 [Ziziphus jujuba var. spinosa]|uniref:Uncharacterized protein n=1 Tax=Ziziphus jujuba var. spinosa TaxID=714518 RepID=A0A978VQH6_ZIZJJ|nr:hypothetical protein FEM48_Zijuj03G0131700 [Ziziphus jujuba var. spinosa]